MNATISIFGREAVRSRGFLGQAPESLFLANGAIV
jgi:hypothetical protein